MPASLKLYRILSYILIPIALLLITALANPSVLIFVFAIACLVIYTFASFSFLKRGIEKEQHQSAKLKDWIKVNAYVSLFLCSLFFLNGTSILMSSDAVLMKITEEFMQQQAGLPEGLNVALMLKVIKAASIFLLVTGVVGLMHIRTTLRLVKEYNYLFE
jgi:phosphatidylglycerophosphate synthase